MDDDLVPIFFSSFNRADVILRTRWYPKLLHRLHLVVNGQLFLDVVGTAGSSSFRIAGKYMTVSNSYTPHSLGRGAIGRAHKNSGFLKGMEGAQLLFWQLLGHGACNNPSGCRLRYCFGRNRRMRGCKGRDQ